MFKFVRERKDQFKGFQYVIFMRAQLEICAKLISEGNNSGRFKETAPR
mgnify:CR=1 FL=1